METFDFFFTGSSIDINNLSIIKVSRRQESFNATSTPTTPRKDGR